MNYRSECNKIKNGNKTLEKKQSTNSTNGQYYFRVFLALKINVRENFDIF